jgi:hypothetical protein
MIDKTRNNRALMVVRSSTDTAITRNRTRDHYIPEEKTTLTFLERREPIPSMPLEKGSIIDFYA